MPFKARKSVFEEAREDRRHLRPLQGGPGKIRAYYQGLQVGSLS